MIFAMVEEPSEVKAALHFLRYQPSGARSYGGTRYGMHPDPEDLAGHVPEVFAMIETLAAYRSVEAISQIRDLAGLYVGPVDLAMALGFRPDLSDRDFREALRRIVEACHAAGVVAGSFATNGEHAAQLGDLGFDEVVVSSDIGLLSATLSLEIARARSLSGAFA